jgi:hypothetical protein
MSDEIREHITDIRVLAEQMALTAEGVPGMNLTLSKARIASVCRALIAALDASRPEDRAHSLLRQVVNVTDALKDAVWYDRQEQRHPAVTPAMKALADEIRMYMRDGHRTTARTLTQDEEISTQRTMVKFWRDKYEKAIQECWNAINEKIKPGALQGSGWDETATRNGLILATNILMELRSTMNVCPERKP